MKTIEMFIEVPDWFDKDVHCLELRRPNPQAGLREWHAMAADK